jgi:hypothetical protein
VIYHEVREDGCGPDLIGPQKGHDQQRRQSHDHWSCQGDQNGVAFLRKQNAKSAFPKGRTELLCLIINYTGLPLNSISVDNYRARDGPTYAISQYKTRTRILILIASFSTSYPR